ncbi:PrsW family intramembrane metalloprotease [Microbacterium sp.]|uniref:PrsW family intramembrane metalloprotease n=1 Tax=Microbacterium sp. TaxID=51671 RepID=UPI0037C9D750
MTATSSPVALAPAAPAAPVAPIPVPVTAARRAGWITGIVLLALLLAFYLAVLYGMLLGNIIAIIAAFAALVPLAIVVAVVVRVDRWEPEPHRLLWFAGLWGAIGSIALTELYLMLFGTADVFASIVIQAPILEEITKGIGVLLLFLFARRFFDGPVDGLVYGGLVGAGFAFTENIQYFGQALAAGGFDALGESLFLRGLLSPFVHVIATGLTGLALGLAARRGLSRGGCLAWGLGGLAAAIAFHGLWNFTMVTMPFEVGYPLIQVPLFALFVWGVVYLLRKEQKLTAARLTEYANVGWFTPAEVIMLSTPKGRREALRWAATQPGDRRPEMRKLITAATGLAYARERAMSGRDTLASTVDEPAFLQAVVAARSEVLRPV